MSDAAAVYASRFGSPPRLVVAAPGRVNLIGDHTDYCGLPVLPMAIDRGIQVAAGPAASDDGVTVLSTLDGAELATARDGPHPGWAKYVLAVLAELRPAAGDRGARLAIDGDLPATGGLSSSSALTVGCVLALDELWNLGRDAADVITTAIAAERAAAIAGGAMDQTVITRARPGHALRIDFDPPSHRHVAIPADFTFVAGYSGSPAVKGEAAADDYHALVLGARASAALLAAKAGRPRAGTPQLSALRESPIELLKQLPNLSAAEAAAVAGGDRLGLPGDRMLDLRTTAEHVLSEAGRVDAAETALRTATLDTLGRLMDESHESLRRAGASTAGLDVVVEAARAAGAAGARLTGAGFGGWAIAAAAPEVADAVTAAMVAASGGPAFVVTPSGGALWSLPGR